MKSRRRIGEEAWIGECPSLDGMLRKQSISHVRDSRQAILQK